MVPFNIDYQETLGSHFMSFIDLSMVNELYGCKKICEATKSAQCEMGGFPNPNDCSKCVCPGGYAGDTCNERPDEGCGSKIDATPEWKELTDVLGNYGVWQPLEDYTKCYYWIESPENTDIVVEIVSLVGHQAVDGCIFTGVEIKTNEDQKLTGFRFCAPQDAGKTLVSSSNRVPIITWNKIARSTTVLRFRHVPAAKPRPSSSTHRKTIERSTTTSSTKTPSSTAPTPSTAPPPCTTTDHPSSVLFQMSIAIVQAGSILYDTPATLDKLERLTKEATDKGAKLVLFPEAFIGGYPKGSDFGIVLGTRSMEGREEFSKYFNSAIEENGAESRRIAEIAITNNVFIVVGVVERSGGTLYCSVLTNTACSYGRRVVISLVTKSMIS
ncbi:unnamed protein product [Haemonchus placei]|uniref:CN hydrolase domain-containing protein n=1 Tax=Haemonchus placei TaxID=6290 RepID=A0A0N4X995_HAEPC|nr:unnamed protein product [Haemonchus placei]